MYDRAVFEKVLSDKEIVEKIKSRCLFGDLEHPEESAIKLNKDTTSHIVSGIVIEGDVVKADFDILPTPAGQFIDTLLRAGCQVGTSTRAEGELEEINDEKDGKYYRVVPESYQFVTIDFTGDPSTFGSEPEKIMRAVQGEYESHRVNKEVALAILESLHTEEATKLRDNISIDKQHKGCKNHVGEKKCTECKCKEIKDGEVIDESMKWNPAIVIDGKTYQIDRIAYTLTNVGDPADVKKFDDLDLVTKQAVLKRISEEEVIEPDKDKPSTEPIIDKKKDIPPPKCPLCGEDLEDVGNYKWDCPLGCLPQAMELGQIEDFAKPFNEAKGDIDYSKLYYDKEIKVSHPEVADGRDLELSVQIKGNDGRPDAQVGHFGYNFWLRPPKAIKGEPYASRMALEKAIETMLKHKGFTIKGWVEKSVEAKEMKEATLSPSEISSILFTYSVDGYWAKDKKGETLFIGTYDKLKKEGYPEDMLSNAMKNPGQWQVVESKLKEMKLNHEGKEYSVYLLDDGTMDTVIQVNGKEARFDGEYTAQYRDKDGAMTEQGLITLAKEAIDSGMIDESQVKKALACIKELKIELATAIAERDTAISRAKERLTVLTENYQKDVASLTETLNKQSSEIELINSLAKSQNGMLVEATVKFKALEESLQKQRAEFEAELTKIKEANNETIRQIKGNLEKAISEKTEANHKEINQLNEKSKQLVDAHTLELDKTKSEHQKQMLRKYYETVLKVSGLKLTEKALALLETCQSEQEIDSTIEDIRKTLRESFLHSEKLTDVKVPVSTLTPGESQIKNQVGKAFSGMK
jgi:hypothetical protein